MYICMYVYTINITSLPHMAWQHTHILLGSIYPVRKRAVTGDNSSRPHSGSLNFHLISRCRSTQCTRHANSTFIIAPLVSVWRYALLAVEDGAAASTLTKWVADGPAERHSSISRGKYRIYGTPERSAHQGPIMRVRDENIIKHATHFAARTTPAA